MPGTFCWWETSRGRNAASNRPKSSLSAVINYCQVIIKRPPSFLRSAFYRSLRGPSCTREKLDLSRSLVSRSEKKEQCARSYLLDLLLPPLIFFVPSYYQDPCACPFKRQKDNGISRPSISSRPCISRLHMYLHSPIRSAISTRRMIERISDMEMLSRKANRWTAIQWVRSCVLVQWMDGTPKEQTVVENIDTSTIDASSIQFDYLIIRN